MKNRSLLPALLLSLMTTALTAQRTATGSLESSRFLSPVTARFDRVLIENDTLLGDAFSLECSDQVTSFFSDNWGFIAGTNGYEDAEKAQRITLGEGNNFKVLEIWGFFAVASEINDGPLRTKVYGVTSGGAPGTNFGTSNDINVSDVALSTTSIVPTIFTFPAPASVTGTEIFISLDVSDLYATQDTVALWMSEEGCGDGNDAWELWGDGSGWFPIDVAPSWQLESNWLLGVVVQFDPIASSQSEPSAGMNGLRIFPASPNPASEDIEISYNLDKGSKVQIEIYSTEGKLLQRIDKGFQAPGRFNETLGASHLPAGAYVYGVITENARLMNRFVVE